MLDIYRREIERKDGTITPVWYVRIPRPGGGVLRRSLGTADEATARLKADAIEAGLGVKGADGKLSFTLDAACARYLVEHAAYLPKPADVQRSLATALRLLGGQKLLEEVADNDVARMVAARRGEKAVRFIRYPKTGRTELRPLGRRVSAGTVNRDLTALRAVFNMAADRWSGRVPSINWEDHFLREPAPRDAWLTAEQVGRVLDKAAPHLKGPLTFALFTGLRLGNVVNLDWRQVDLTQRQVTIRIKDPEYEGGRPHAVPLIDPVVILLANLDPKESGPVWFYRGKGRARKLKDQPIKEWKGAWKGALKRAGLEPKDWRWHDLRHTCATWMLHKGVPLDVVQLVLGHADIRTTQRYAHHVRQAKLTALNTLTRPAVSEMPAHPVVAPEVKKLG